LSSACITATVAAAAGARESLPDVAEASLVQACAGGDRAAMSRLYQLYQRRVFTLLVRMVGRDDAEELAQEVFIRIFRGLPRFRGDAALGTWVYRLTMNVSLSFLTRTARRRRQDARLAESPPALAQGPVDANPWLRERLERALGELPAGYRAVLVLHDVEGLNHEEISAILGCRVGTSKSQLHKARMRMRALLQPGSAAEARP
jgi:RNA polymerase sigma-70 factor (ECF subfamily)